MAIDKNMTTYKIQCKLCKDDTFILARNIDINEWINGKLIQDVLFYLTPDERELLISRTCSTCWSELLN